jgi:hypothetical protein
MNMIDLKDLTPGDLVEYQQPVSKHTARGTYQRWQAPDDGQARLIVRSRAAGDRLLHRPKASDQHHPPKRGHNVSQNTEEALRRQTLLRVLGLAVVGTGRCPLCHQQAEVFARRSALPGPTKECCLDCWKAQRATVLRPGC